MVDKWCHLAGTYSAEDDTARLYVNGVEVVTKTKPTDKNMSVNNEPVRIATHPWGRYFDGIIDEVAIYKRALTPEEIWQHYQNGLMGQGYEEAPPPPEMPDDTMFPTGAVHAYPNTIWPPNNKMVTVTLEGYVVDELSMARDGSNIGVSSAYLMIDGTKINLQDVLGEDGSFSVTTKVRAVKGAVYTVELWATDTEPEDPGGPNWDLVDSTYIRVPHDMGKR